jgi:signal peptidase I
VSKQKTAEKPSEKPSSGRPAASTSSIVPTERAIRETVESVAIAFVLAFLFRTFEAEAFVIPTGSMAPTLQGMHKDVNCPECGFAYRAGASNDSPDEARQHGRGPIVSSVCPMCAYRRTDVRQETSYNGDRILVSKFAYDIGDPQRWDVFVFRYPGDAKINYIKRLVGLPNETLTIRNGDIFVRKDGEPREQIARKPPDKVLAMLMDVYDNQYISQRLDQAGWPRRWFVSHPTEGGWVEKTEPESMQVRVHEHGVKKSTTVQRLRQKFETSGGAKTSWITYQHFLPEAPDWQRLENLKQPSLPAMRRDTIQGDGVLARPHAITDDYAYNDSDSVGRDRDAAHRLERKNWVGDLALECQFQDIKKQGSVMLQLAEGGLGFECRLDLAEGTATLTYADLEKEATKLPFDAVEKGAQPNANSARRVAQTTLGKNPSAKVLFANVDDQLLVWVDGELVKFDGPTTYSTPRNHVRNDADHLRPVRLGAQGAALRVDQLRVLRDVYYIATQSNAMFDQENGVTFEIGSDQFFAMGDNSPASQDSRIWNQLIAATPHTVDRRMLIGKALFIYWPHSLDYFPFCPNIPRMGFVR